MTAARWSAVCLYLFIIIITASASRPTSGRQRCRHPIHVPHALRLRCQSPWLESEFRRRISQHVDLEFESPARHPSTHEPQIAIALGSCVSAL